MATWNTYSPTNPYSGWTRDKKKGDEGYVDPWGMRAASDTGWGGANTVWINDAAMKARAGDAAGSLERLQRNGWVPQGWDPGFVYSAPGAMPTTAGAAPTTQATYDAYAKPMQSQLQAMLAGSQADTAQANQLASADPNVVTRLGAAPSGGFSGKAITTTNSTGTNLQPQYSDMNGLIKQAGAAAGPQALIQGGAANVLNQTYRPNTLYVTKDNQYTPAAAKANEISQQAQSGMSLMGLTGIPQATMAVGNNVARPLAQGAFDAMNGPRLNAAQAGSNLIQQAAAPQQPTQPAQATSTSTSAPPQPAAYSSASTGTIAAPGPNPQGGEYFPGQKTTAKTMAELMADNAAYDGTGNGGNRYSGLVDKPELNPYLQGSPYLKAAENSITNLLASQKSGLTESAKRNAANGGLKLATGTMDRRFADAEAQGKVKIYDENSKNAIAWNDQQRAAAQNAGQSAISNMLGLSADSRANMTAGSQAAASQAATKNAADNTQIARDSLNQQISEFNTEMDFKKALMSNEWPRAIMTALGAGAGGLAQILSTKEGQQGAKDLWANLANTAARLGGGAMDALNKWWDGTFGQHPLQSAYGSTEGLFPAGGSQLGGAPSGIGDLNLGIPDFSGINQGIGGFQTQSNRATQQGQGLAVSYDGTANFEQWVFQQAANNGMSIEQLLRAMSLTAQA